MSRQDEPQGDPASLRKRAKAMTGADKPPLLESMSPEEAGRTLQELRIHQIELQMQNEELRREQVELDAEGTCVIDSKNSQSRFHLALHISYPNAADRERASKLGVSPGGGVEIHGLEAKYAWLGSLHRQINWTAGCVAVTNPEIDEIYKLVPVGTPVEIRP